MNQPKEIDFLEPGVLEGLIQENRGPIGFSQITFRDSNENGEVISETTKTSFWLPPEGTKENDRMIGIARGVYNFISPNGEHRGIATMHTVTQEIGDQIQARIEEILKSKE